MFRGLIIAAVVACAAAGSTGAAYASAGHTDVTISTAPTHNMALNNGVYSPTGNGAVLNVNDLTNALNAGNLEVTTGAAAGTHPGNIDIQAAFHWVSGYALTLDAFHSIRVDQPVTDAGTGALTLTTNDGGANGHLEFSAGANITFWGLANALTIDGKAYTLVNNVASLAAAVTANPNGNYALAASYDAAVDHTYKADPIPAFGGHFEGLGNAISNVSIRNATGYIGFFSTIGAGASVSNFHLKSLTIFESLRSWVYAVGGLAAVSDGALYGDDTSGTVTDHGSAQLGGLIGSGGGSITRCSSAVTVTALGTGGSQGEGGLAGAFGGAITDSFATGDVRGSKFSHDLGGLVGGAGGPISHSHATGIVSGFLFFGFSVGGLVGTTSAPITDSYAIGDVKVRADYLVVGGLVGYSTSSVTRSFATGRLKGDSTSFGGLVGAIENTASITDSYAIVAVTTSGGPYAVASGLVADGGRKHLSSVSTSYAAGKIADPSDGGGFGCGLDPSEVSNDYWDMTTSGTTYGVCGNTNIPGVTGLTTTQLRSGLPAGFNPKIWAQDRKINRGFPYLIANPPPQ